MSAKGHASPAPAPPAPLAGHLVEFESPGTLLEACRKVRDAGYVQWDAHSPFPVHGLDEAMGVRRTILPVIVFVAGATGTACAFLLQWWCNAVPSTAGDLSGYPYLVSGKPFFSFPAYVPILFELTVLFAGLTALATMFALNGLPRFYHPLFTSGRFRAATSNRFYISVEASDPKFDPAGTAAFLKGLGGTWFEEIRG